MTAARLPAVATMLLLSGCGMAIGLAMVWYGFSLAKTTWFQSYPEFRAIREKTPARSFTALCLAALDPASGRLTWVNAGLPEPMLRTGADVGFLATPDPRLPLGIHADLAYRQETAVLAPGDVLVLYSDGLPETPGHDGQPYGYDRARARLATLEVETMTAREILDALVSDVRARAASDAPADDMTLVVVRREPA